MKKLLALFILAILVVVACEKAEPGNNKNENGKPGNKVENITIPSTVDTTPTVTEGKDSVKVQFTAATSWTASIINTKADNWCTVYPTSGPAGNVEIEIKVTENTTPDERSATINIVSGETTKSITVTQKQKDALTITESSMEVPAEGGEIAIEVKANVSFKHTVDADASSWIKYINTKALKTSNMIFDIMENDDLDSRKGCIYVTDGTLTDTITIYQAGGKPFIVLGSNEVSLEPVGGSFDIEVRHNVDATLETVFPKGVTPWLKEVQSKAASTNKYTFAADENTTYSSRTAMIIALNRDASVADTVYVTQKQNNAIILGNDLYYLSCKGGEFNIKIQSNVKATAEPLFPANVTPWFEKASTKALTDSTYSFIAQENTAIEPRTAHVVFKNTETNITDTVTVTQYQKGLVIGEKAFTIEMQGGNLKVDLAENVSVQVKYKTNDTGGWIDASVSNKQCILNIAKNESYSDRNALILLNNADNSNKDTIQITQKQTNAIILGNKECYVKAAGGKFTIRVQSNVTAIAQPVFPENVQPWFTATETKALTESTYIYSADENTSSQPRSAIIIFQNTESNVADTVTVTQYQKGLILGEKVVNVNAAASNYTVNFIENARFSKSFEIEGNNGWIEAQVDGKKGILNISRNATYDKRALGLIFSNLDNTITDTLKVYQAQNDTLIIDVNDTLRTLDSREQVITIKVDNNIDLTSSVQCESGDWIHKVETKGLKTSSFDFLIDENTGETKRKGYITFASAGGSLNKTLTVVQDAVYNIILSEDTLSFNWNDAGATIATISVESSVSYDFKKLIENRFSYFSIDNITENQYEVYTNQENHTFGCNKNYIMFYNEEYNISDTLFVIQFGKPQVKDTRGNNINELNYTFAAEANEARIPIKANYDWKIELSDSYDWCTEGNHVIKHDLVNEIYGDTVVLNLSENTAGQRSSKINFIDEDGNITEWITVTQEGTETAFVIDIAEIGETITMDDVVKLRNVKLVGDVSSVQLQNLSKSFLKKYATCEILDLSELNVVDEKLIRIHTENIKVLYLPQNVKTICGDFFDGYNSNDSYDYAIEEVYFGENSKVEVIEAVYTDASTGGWMSMPSFPSFKGAFSGCKNLKNIVFPASLKELHGYAFYGSGLKSASFEACTAMKVIKPHEKTQTGFLAGVSIEHMILPPNLETIADYSFNLCKFQELTINDNVKISLDAFAGANIGKVNSKYSDETGKNIIVKDTLIYSCPFVLDEPYYFPSNAKYIREWIFNFSDYYYETFIFPEDMPYLPEGIKLMNMEELTEIKLPLNLKEIPDYFLHDVNSRYRPDINVNFPETLEKIGKYAFNSRVVMSNFKFGNNIKEIAANAFTGSNIEKAILPKTIKMIGDSAFYSCDKLQKFEIESGIDSDNFSIGKSVLCGCENLYYVTIPEGLKSIPEYMFAGTPIYQITLPNSIKDIYDCAFYNCTSLMSITFPASLETIGNNAFEYCSALSSINIPESVKEIGEKAFSKCTSLSEVVLSKSVTQISDGIFSGCSSLNNIAIPSTVTKIGEEVFMGCTSLSKVELSTALSSIGKDAFNRCTSLKGIVIPESVDFMSESFNESGLLKAEFAGSRTIIPEGALSGCKSLQEIIIPETVTTISKGAFEGCNTLANVKLPNSIYTIEECAFSDCKSLQSIVIPESISSMYLAFANSGLKKIEFSGARTVIPTYAFAQCHSLTDVTLPKSLVTIEKHAFAGCESLTHITIPETVSTMAYAFGSYSNSAAISEVKFEGARTIIPEYAFYCCGSIKEFVIPETIEIIGNYAFGFCTSLTKIQIPESVKSMKYAFSGSAISEVIFTGNRTSIPEYALAGCEFERYIVPETITTIEKGAFIRCENLIDIQLPSALKTIGEEAFSYCTALKEITIPQAVTAIERRAFSSCQSLAYIQLPSALKTIGEEAFSSCQSLAYIQLPSALKTIGEEAFSYCMALKEITIPQAVTTLGSYIFQGSSISTIYMKPLTPPSLPNSNSYLGSNFLKLIYVPSNVVESYKNNANWSKYSSIITGYSY